MIMQRVWPPLALALSACAATPDRPQPIRAVAEARQCPAYPLPPVDLLKPPARTDFLPAMPSSPRNKPSSSTS